MPKRLPPLHALRAFESAARHASFTQAADELNITQGAISRHIKNLENYYDRQLFRRNGPRLEITEQGEIFSKELRKGFKIIEEACFIVNNRRDLLRLKAPSTLTMRWLLECLNDFKKNHTTFEVQLSSIWMDIDRVDFTTEHYDCAILLGDGKFGSSTKSIKLFDEWLIPVCAPSMENEALENIKQCELIHPSLDRRDWRRWLEGVKWEEMVNITKGKIFDTLEQGNVAAMSGYGVSVSDLIMASGLVNDGRLCFPFKTAVSTGDGYYFVWPIGSVKEQKMRELIKFLSSKVPDITLHKISIV